MERTIDQIQNEYFAATHVNETMKYGSAEQKEHMRTVVGPLWRDVCAALKAAMPPCKQMDVEEYNASPDCYTGKRRYSFGRRIR